jgi:hypothetical protein
MFCGFCVAKPPAQELSTCPVARPDGAFFESTQFNGGRTILNAGAALRAAPVMLSESSSCFPLNGETVVPHMEVGQIAKQLLSGWAACGLKDRKAIDVT